MTTKEEMIAIIKSENPDGLRVGNEIDGYTSLTNDEYNAQILEWADNRLAKETEEEEITQIETAKAALLERLGLTEEEARLLLS
jgi:bifunctional pyridoxal-dependent enzyme with beta-cystathionase and maltose regulon repressor activities